MLLCFVDYQLHGRESCGNWIIRNRFPGKVMFAFVHTFSCLNFFFCSCTDSFSVACTCRLNVWRLVRLLQLRRFYRTSGTRIGSFKSCDPWITAMSSPWSIASSLPQAGMNFSLTWWWGLFLSHCIVYWSITAIWTRGCRLYMSSYTPTR